MNRSHRVQWLVAVLLLTSVSFARAQDTQTHTVQPEETLYRIARQYNTTVAEIRRLNGLENNTITIGQELLVPGGETGREAAVQEGQHRVQPGETIYSIAARYDVSPDSLLAVNGDLDRGRPLPPDRALQLPRQFQTVEYTVRSGNTLGGIARRYGVSVTAIQRANNLQSNQIRVGQVLTIPSRAVPEPDPAGSLGSVDTTGAADVYPETFAGRLTASGAPYDPDEFTASHPELPFGSVLLLTNPANSQSTFVRIVDRGPVEPGVLLEISSAAADVLDLGASSDTSLEVRRVK